MIKSAADIVSDVVNNKLHRTIIEREIIQHSILSEQDPEGKESYFKRTMFQIQDSVKRNVFFQDWVNNDFRNILEEPKLSLIIAGIDKIMDERTLEAKREIESEGIYWTDNMFDSFHIISEKYFRKSLDEIYPQMVIYGALKSLCDEEIDNNNIWRWFPNVKGRDALLAKIREKMVGKKGAGLAKIYFALRENNQVKAIDNREIPEFFRTIKDICGFAIGDERTFRDALNRHSSDSDFSRPSPNAYSKGEIQRLAEDLH